jgi:ElaB/YqjD/DUF883 family membrane-anchored ribosome-binding protein
MKVDLPGSKQVDVDADRLLRGLDDILGSLGKATVSDLVKEVYNLLDKSGSLTDSETLERITKEYESSVENVRMWLVRHYAKIFIHQARALEKQIEEIKQGKFLVGVGVAAE